MTKDDDSNTFTITDPGGASRPFTAERVTITAPPGSTAARYEVDGKPVLPGGRWVVYGPEGSVPFTYSLDVTGHRRRPGARTLGAWRRKVMLPDAALDTLMGGEQTAEQVKATLTPETVIALGTLVAIRLSRPHLPETIREQVTFRDDRTWTHPLAAMPGGALTAPVPT